MKCPVHDIEMQYMDYSSTLVGYYSPPGHDHDDNCKIHTWKCPEGEHAVREYKQNVCLVEGCGWHGKEHCDLCGDFGIRVGK
jgi:hypothetical protein